MSTDSLSHSDSDSDFLSSASFYKWAHKIGEPVGVKFYLSDLYNGNYLFLVKNKIQQGFHILLLLELSKGKKMIITWLVLILGLSMMMMIIRII